MISNLKIAGACYCFFDFYQLICKAELTRTRKAGPMASGQIILNCLSMWRPGALLVAMLQKEEGS